MSMVRHLKLQLLFLSVLLSFTIVMLNVYDVTGDGFDGVTDPTDEGSQPSPSGAGSDVEVLAGTTSIGFDDASHHDCVNTRYLALGIEFQRDDGQCVHAYDWAALSHLTTSPPMVLATTSGPGAATYVTHINLLFSEDTYYVGAYFGNDQFGGMTWTLEIFDINDNLIGSVSLVSNGNTNVDELLEISSVVPMRRARFENDTTTRSVVLDDVTFNGLDTCGGLAPTIIGTLGADLLVGTPGDDVILGLDGSDYIFGYGGDDVICGGAGDDGIFGGDGKDTLFGEGEGDVLDGGNGNDKLIGGPGDDVLLGRQGRDRGNCGGGNDYFNGGPQVDGASPSCETIVNVP